VQSVVGLDSQISTAFEKVVAPVWWQKEKIRSSDENWIGEENEPGHQRPFRTNNQKEPRR
jgi:hypothetical protein